MLLGGSSAWRRAEGGVHLHHQRHVFVEREKKARVVAAEPPEPNTREDENLLSPLEPGRGKRSPGEARPWTRRGTLERRAPGVGGACVWAREAESPAHNKDPAHSRGDPDLLQTWAASKNDR